VSQKSFLYYYFPDIYNMKKCADLKSDSDETVELQRPQQFGLIFQDNIMNNSTESSLS